MITRLNTKKHQCQHVLMCVLKCAVFCMGDYDGDNLKFVVSDEG